MGQAYKFFGYPISCNVVYIPRLFWNYVFELLNLLTSSPIPQHLRLNLATIKMLSVFMIQSLFFA